jgi:hypothetical protein
MRYFSSHTWAVAWYGPHTRARRDSTPAFPVHTHMHLSQATHIILEQHRRRWPGTRFIRVATEERRVWRPWSAHPGGLFGARLAETLSHMRLAPHNQYQLCESDVCATHQVCLRDEVRLTCRQGATRGPGTMAAALDTFRHGWVGYVIKRSP